jgi:PHP family Zn ribbon phosphoesterase
LAFVEKYKLPFTAGSDAHSPSFLGKSYLEIPGENLSVEEILKTIKNKNVQIGSSKANFFEKLIDHIKRNLAKIKHKI